MSKNVVVNGETREGVSVLRLFDTGGAAVLFKDIDEISSVAGLAEIACGTFTVPAETGGGTPNQTSAFTVPHGMNSTPDGWYIIPKYWYDTIEKQHVVAAWHKASRGHTFVGRRSLTSGTEHFGGAIGNTYEQADETYIYPITSSIAPFEPAYTDSEGNVKTQEYIWIAFKLAD